MFSQRRKRCCKRCCWGYFALIFPVNFLEGRQHRITILSAFALSTAEVLATVIHTQPEKNPFLKVLLKICNVLVTTVACSPILTCFSADTNATLLIGIVYTVMFIFRTFFIAILTQIDKDDDGENLRVEHVIGVLVSEIIVLVSGIVVLCGYIQRICKKCKMKSTEETTTHRYQRIYMQKLLTGKVTIDSERRLSDALLTMTGVKIVKEDPEDNKCVACWKAKVYASTPGFRYGLSLLISLTVGITALSFMIIKFLAKFIAIRNYILYDILQQVEIKNVLSKIPLPNLLQAVVKKVFKTTKITTEWRISAYQLIYDQFEVFLTCLCVVIAFVYAVMYYTSMNILRSYKENILSLHQRKRDSHLLKLKTMSNVSLVVSAVQYSGYQVAYILWGALLQIVVSTFILILLCEVVFLPLKYGSWSVVQAIYEWLAPIILTMIITKGIQCLLVRFCFLQEKGKILALDNRRGFYLMMYFMFYYNIFMGLFSCLLRITKATIFGLYFLPRLDRSIFPRTFEHLDGGFKSYTCLMKLEAMQSNVIVTCFANTLLKKEPFDQPPGEDDAIETELSNTEIDQEEKDKIDLELRRRKNVARNRWHLAYTLWRNPDLIHLRGLQTQFGEDDQVKMDLECETAA